MIRCRASARSSRPTRAASNVRIAITALSPTIRRVPEAERALVDSGDVDEAAKLTATASSPIDDVRGSANYRRAMAEVIARRAIAAAIARAKGERIPMPASPALHGATS